MGTAQALPFINGTVSFSDGGITLGATPTSIVHLLHTITQGTPATYVGGFTFTLLSVSNIVGTPLHGSGGKLTDALDFDLAGLVSGPGFSPTDFLGTWTGQGACRGSSACQPYTKTASWSVSLAAVEHNTPVPEPSTFVLLGLGLVGLGFASYRKRS